MSVCVIVLSFTRFEVPKKSECTNEVPFGLVCRSSYLPSESASDHVLLQDLHTGRMTQVQVVVSGVMMMLTVMTVMLAVVVVAGG